MEKRRKHEECGLQGCEVVLGRICEASEAKRGKMGIVGRSRGRFECMGLVIDPRLLILAVLIFVFSVLVNVFVGARVYQQWGG